MMMGFLFDFSEDVRFITADEDVVTRGELVSPAAVSYTHLTLPTIYSV